MNITTVEDQKITVELSGQGFCIVCQNAYDTIQNQEAPPSEYFETPYSLLDKISPGYRKAFGDNLEKALRKLSQEQSFKIELASRRYAWKAEHARRQPEKLLRFK